MTPESVLPSTNAARPDDTVYRVVPPVPRFTLAVTGHRDIATTDGCDALRGAITASLETVRGAFPANVPSVRCRLISPLAQGADQLVAEAATEMRDEKELSAWELQVVLPFERESYRGALGDRSGSSGAIAEGEHARSRFDTLLACATTVLELADRVQPVGVDVSPVARHLQNRRFATLGELLASQADLVLAIWRGTPAAGRGGTADVVATALRHRVPVLRLDPDTLELSLLWPSDGTDDAVLLARETPGAAEMSTPHGERLRTHLADVLSPPRPAVPVRFGIDPPVDSVQSFLGLASASRASPYDLARRSRLPLFGRVAGERCGTRSRWSAYQRFQSSVVALFERSDPLRVEADRVEKAPDSASGKTAGTRSSDGERARARKGLRVDFASRDPTGRAIDGVVPAVDADVRAAFVASDAIATALGHAYRSSYVITFLGAVLAVWLGLLGLFSHHHKWVFVLAELITLLTLIGFYLVANKRGWHRRWLNARYVAESLRGARLLSRVGFAGRRALGERASWTSWLVDAVMSGPGVPSVVLSPNALAEIASDALAHVEDQRKYHGNNHARLRAIHHGLDVLGWCSVGIAVVVAAVYVGFVDPWHCHGLVDCGAGLQTIKYAVTAICAGLPLLAAALAGIRYQGDFERFATRSEETETALDGIVSRLVEVETRAREALKPLGPLDPPLYEELVHVLNDLAHVYRADLEDWRYVYSARPSPAPG